MKYKIFLYLFSIFMLFFGKVKADIIDELDAELSSKKNGTFIDLQDSLDPVFETVQPTSNRGTTDITASSDLQNNLDEIFSKAKDIAKGLKGIENRIENLSQALSVREKLKNQLNLSIKVKNSSHRNLNSIRVMLDNIELSSILENYITLNNSSDIPIYQGFISPGEHNIEVNLRTIKTNPKNTSLFENYFENFKEIIAFKIENNNQISDVTIAVDLENGVIVKE